MRSIKAIATLVLCALIVCGCFGGGASVKTTTTTVSVGQQLIDLQNAYQSGSMTQDQYQKAKKQLIQRTLDN